MLCNACSQVMNLCRLASAFTGGMVSSAAVLDQTLSQKPDEILSQKPDKPSQDSSFRQYKPNVVHSDENTSNLTYDQSKAKVSAGVNKNDLVLYEQKKHSLVSSNLNLARSDQTPPKYASRSRLANSIQIISNLNSESSVCNSSMRASSNNVSNSQPSPLINRTNQDLSTGGYSVLKEDFYRRVDKTSETLGNTLGCSLSNDLAPVIDNLVINSSESDRYVNISRVNLKQSQDESSTDSCEYFGKNFYITSKSASKGSLNQSNCKPTNVNFKVLSVKSDNNPVVSDNVHVELTENPLYSAVNHSVAVPVTGVISDGIRPSPVSQFPWKCSREAVLEVEFMASLSRPLMYANSLLPWRKHIRRGQVVVGNVVIWNQIEIDDVRLPACRLNANAKPRHQSSVSYVSSKYNNSYSAQVPLQSVAKSKVGTKLSADFVADSDSSTSEAIIPFSSSRSSYDDNLTTDTEEYYSDSTTTTMDSNLNCLSLDASECSRVSSRNETCSRYVDDDFSSLYLSEETGKKDLLQTIMEHSGLVEHHQTSSFEPAINSVKPWSSSFKSTLSHSFGSIYKSPDQKRGSYNSKISNNHDDAVSRELYLPNKDTRKVKVLAVSDIKKKNISLKDPYCTRKIGNGGSGSNPTKTACSYKSDPSVSSSAPVCEESLDVRSSSFASRVIGGCSASGSDVKDYASDSGHQQVHFFRSLGMDSPPSACLDKYFSEDFFNIDKLSDFDLL